MISKLEVIVPKIILTVIIAIAAIFLYSAAQGDSAIFDETAHVVAGYTYVRHLDYRFNPEHPPLIKVLAGLPLLFKNLQFPTDKDYWTGINEQWSAGNQFLYWSGNDPNSILLWARLGPIIVTLLLILFTYLFTQELIGRWWALLPALLVSFSPIVLAHGHYVTTDAGAALGILIAIRYFLKWLHDQSRKNFIFAGIAFGIAQAIKFSSVLLVPYFLLIAAIFAIVEIIKIRSFFELRFKKFIRSLTYYIFFTAAIMAVGYLIVVYPIYSVTTWNYPIEKQVSDTKLTLQNFSIPPVANAVVQLAGYPITRPMAEYALGVLMVMQRSAGGNNAFFLGELSSHGWWYYFPLIYLMKEPLPILALIAIAAFLGVSRILGTFHNGFNKTYQKGIEFLTIRFTEFSIIVFIAIYWASSVSSPLNIGVRHILPTLPLAYIIASGSIKKWFGVQPVDVITTIWGQTINIARTVFNIWVKTIILSALVIWLVLETAIAAPYFLSYFNEAAGGRFNGFQYATDSNFDWGQDLKRLQIWVADNLNPDQKIAVDYFGGGDPRYFLGNHFEPWWSAKGSPKDDNIEWLAISINTLQGALAKPAPDFYRNPADEYRWLENPYKFTERAGTSILIYKL